MPRAILALLTAILLFGRMQIAPTARFHHHNLPSPPGQSCSLTSCRAPSPKRLRRGILAHFAHTIGEHHITLPNTTGAIHRAFWFDWQLSPGNNGGIDKFALESGAVDFVSGAQEALPGYQHPVPGVSHLYYYPWRLDGSASGGTGVTSFLNNHPDWIVYQNDRVTPAWGGGSPGADLNRAPLDMSNPAVLSYLMATYLNTPITTGGFAGIAFDVCSTVNSDNRAGIYQADGTLSASASAGASTIQTASTLTTSDTISFGTASNVEYHQITAVSGSTITLDSPLVSNHASGENLGKWVQQYTHNHLDNAYRQATISAFTNLVTLIKAANPNALVFINDQSDFWDSGTDQMGVHAYDYWRDLVPIADGVLDEGGFTAGANAPYRITSSPSQNGQPNPFAFLVTNYRWAQSIGKAVQVVDYQPYSTPSGITDSSTQARADMQWAMASYFLVNEGAAWLTWRGHTQTNGEVYNQSEYIYAAQLGSPTAAPTQHADGSWTRTFTNGTVLLNPSPTTTITPTVRANTGRPYRDLYGSAVPSSFSLPPLSAITLLDTPAMNLAPAPLTTERPQAALTLQTLVANIRSDLADSYQAGTSQEVALRWSDTDLHRQIDRVLEEYSRVSPNILAMQIPTITRSRLYPSPDACWWLERVEYPTGSWPKQWRTFQERQSPLIAPPPAGTSIATSPGSLTGLYSWAVSFLVPGANTQAAGGVSAIPNGETPPSPLISATLSSQQATLSNIPLGPYGVVDRNLYRTKAGASQLQLLGPLGDNTTSIFLDNAADASLGANAPTTNSTDGIPQFELHLDASSLPADTTGTLELTAAYKHELDALGTTVPEKHWDVLALGAEAYALFQYLTTTNDNLDYVDGQFRDRVDDTHAPLAWRTQAATIMTRYQARLTEIKNEVSHISTPLPQWGDKPARWDRL